VLAVARRAIELALAHGHVTRTHHLGGLVAVARSAGLDDRGEADSAVVDASAD